MSAKRDKKERQEAHAKYLQRQATSRSIAQDSEGPSVNPDCISDEFAASVRSAIDSGFLTALVNKSGLSPARVKKLVAEDSNARPRPDEPIKLQEALKNISTDHQIQAPTREPVGVQ